MNVRTFANSLGWCMLSGDQGLVVGLIFCPWILQLLQPFKIKDHNGLRSRSIPNKSSTRELESVCKYVCRDHVTCKEFRLFHGMDSVISSHRMTPKLKTSDLHIIEIKNEFQYFIQHYFSWSSWSFSTACSRLNPAPRSGNQRN